MATLPAIFKVHTPPLRYPRYLLKLSFTAVPLPRIHSKSQQPAPSAGILIADTLFKSLVSERFASAQAPSDPDNHNV
jgi:hypothetical protein